MNCTGFFCFFTGFYRVRPILLWCLRGTGNFSLRFPLELPSFGGAFFLRWKKEFLRYFVFVYWVLHELGPGFVLLARAYQVFLRFSPELSSFGGIFTVKEWILTVFLSSFFPRFSLELPRFGGIFTVKNECLWYLAFLTGFHFEFSWYLWGIFLVFL